MVASTTPQFEIADEMRVMTERSLEQAKQAFDNYMRATEEAVSAFEAQVEASQRGGLDISRKAMGFAENNVRTAFEFAHKIVQACSGCKASSSRRRCRFCASRSWASARR
ncbi:MAG: hypothetical protein WAK34_12845 [Rhodoplanes sp.]